MVKIGWKNNPIIGCLEQVCGENDKKYQLLKMD